MDVLGGNVIAHCPIRNVLARVGDKWSLLILHALWERREALRFKELQRAIPDISQRVLSATLRRLYEDGLVRCEAFAEVPPWVEYTLTGRGESFHEACRPMLRWVILPGEVFFQATASDCPNYCSKPSQHNPCCIGYTDVVPCATGAFL